MPIASGLATAIKDKFNLKTELVKGHGGILKVTLDGEEVFNNQKECLHMPVNEYILQKIKGAIS